VPLVGEAHRNTVPGERPELFDEPVIQFPRHLRDRNAMIASRPVTNSERSMLRLCRRVVSINRARRFSARGRQSGCAEDSGTGGSRPERRYTGVLNSLELSNVRYMGGVTSYLEVTVAQSAALAEEVTSVNILGRRLANTVQLIQAGGGGWDRSKLPESPERCGKLASNTSH
jgi:hypothetical protein